MASQHWTQVDSESRKNGEESLWLVQMLHQVLILTFHKALVFMVHCSVSRDRAHQCFLIVNKTESSRMFLVKINV